MWHTVCSKLVLRPDECKTYPSPSAQYVETSCVAAMNEAGRLVRLYPCITSLKEEHSKLPMPPTKVSTSSKLELSAPVSRHRATLLLY
jgi:hypothetical protein